MWGSRTYYASKWLGVSLGLALYAVFSFSGCSSCNKKSSPPPAPGKPPVIDSFTITSGDQITNSSYIPYSAAVPFTAFTFSVTAHSPSPNTRLVSYEWSFMDDQYGNPNFVLTTSSPTASYTYTQTNSYLVTVRVIDSNGKFTDSTSCNSAIGTGCLLSFYPRTLLSLVLDPTTSLYNPVPLQVDVQAKAIPTTPGASIVKYEWDCGNGTVFTDTGSFAAVPPYTIDLGICTYTSIGTYTLTAKVTDSLGYFTSASLPAIAEVSIAPLSMYQLDGQGYGVTFKDNYAYLADGTAGVKVIDMSNPSSPLMIGRYWDPYALPVYGCSPFGSYLYCAWGTTVYIFDISNPAAPLLVSRVDKPGGQPFKNVEKVVVTDISGTDYLFVPDHQSGTISIFSLHDFTQATWITDIAAILPPGTSSPAGIYDLFITSTTGVNPTYYAYAAAYTGGFAIYNVTNPTNTTMEGLLLPYDYYLGLTTYDGYVGVTLTDTNYAYVSDNALGVVLVDVRDPASLNSISFLTYPPSSGSPTVGADTPIGLWATGTTVYAEATQSSAGYLYTCTATLPPNTPAISCPSSVSLTPSNSANGIAGGMIGTTPYVFVANQEGINTFTAATGDTPTPVSFYMSSGHTSRVRVTDLLADGFSYTALFSNYYVPSNSSNGLSGGAVDVVGYDLTQGMQPTFLSRFTVPTDTHGTAVAQTTLEGYNMTVGAIAGGAYVYLFDLTNPASPVPINQTLPDLQESWYDSSNNNGNTFPPGGEQYDRISFSDPTHFIVGDASGWGAYSVHIPDAFITPTSYTLYGVPSTMGTIGNDLCVDPFTSSIILVMGGTFSSGACVQAAIDAYDITTATFISQVYLGCPNVSNNNELSMYCDNRYIYATTGSTLDVIDYSDLANPRIVGSYTAPTGSPGIIMTGIKVIDNIGFASYHTAAIDPNCTGGTDNSGRSGGFLVFDLRNLSNIGILGTMDWSALQNSMTFPQDDDCLYGKDLDAFRGPDGNDYVMLASPHRVISFRISGLP